MEEEIERKSRKGRMRESDREPKRWKNKVALLSKIEYGREREINNQRKRTECAIA